MYIWNTKALAHELANETLTQKHYKNYYLATAVFISVIYYYGIYSPYFNEWVILTESICTLLIMIWGVNSAYQANGGDEGKVFIKRITALSFPILVQTSVAGFVFAIVLGSAYQFFPEAVVWLDAWYEWCVCLFTLILQVLFFTRLISYIKRIVQHQI